MKEIELIKIIETEKQKVKTKSLDISFNELLDMSENEEIKIEPEYQRMFRWEKEDQSRFIESIILELPIPPIFVIEIENGIYELIDGLQRVSTYISFRKNELILEGCEILKDLNGKKYDDLPKSIQIKMKRYFVRMEVIGEGSEKELRYHMFKRLNRGGEILSEQEVRNCTIRILDERFINLINELSEYDSFKKVMENLSSEAVNKMKDKEYILRFFAFQYDIENYDRDKKLDLFLTEYMEKIAEGKHGFDYKSEEIKFKRLFDTLVKLGGKNLFATELKSGKIKEDLILYYYDSFTLGLYDVLDSINDDNLDKVKEQLMALKENQELYKRRTGSKSNVKTKRTLVMDAIQTVF